MIRTSFIALFSAAILAAACTKEAVQESAPEPVVQGDTITFPAADKAPKLGTAPVLEERAPALRLNGRLTWDEERTVRVFSPFAGRVARILVQPGDRVSKGQTLAVLGSPEFGQAQAEARRADTDVQLAEKNLQRQKELENAGVAPRKDLQTAEAEFERAKSELERARGRVRLYGSSAKGVDQSFAIASPVAGVVVERNINPGMEVRPDQMTSNAPPLFIVTDPTHLWALLDATEKDLAAVHVGKIVTVRTPVYEGESFRATLVNVSDALDPATRTLKARATLDNKDRKLKAEMFVTGELDTQQPVRIMLPAKAVYFQGGKHYAFTEEGPGRYTRRVVKIGDDHDGKVEVAAGVTPGQKVVIDDVLMLQQMLQPRRVQK
ncbi:MAG TPA: efflux RND transporter periplasmic adaptor subunit [Burkholderiales bacterium]|nr:efflux RND transporter periplasmic adaptor subunit [Burkholderiales bacterium]